MDKSSERDSKSKKLLFLKSNDINFLKFSNILGKISKLQLLISNSVIVGYFLLIEKKYGSQNFSLDFLYNSNELLNLTIPFQIALFILSGIFLCKKTETLVSGVIFTLSSIATGSTRHA